MAEYIDRDKLNKKKKYLLQTQEMPFPKSEYFIKVDDFWSMPTADVIEIPKGATNGDMIKAMFPNGEYGTNGNFVHVYISYFAIIQTMTFDLSWWNAPYTEKRGNENA